MATEYIVIVVATATFVVAGIAILLFFMRAERDLLTEESAPTTREVVARKSIGRPLTYLHRAPDLARRHEQGD